MDDFTQHKAQLIMALRGQGILSAPVLSALESIPREIFVPETLRMHAYENASLPIALDQTISQPYVVARMTEALELTGRERVLEIGTGSGYQAAILTYYINPCLLFYAEISIFVFFFHTILCLL